MNYLRRNGGDGGHRGGVTPSVPWSGVLLFHFCSISSRQKITFSVAVWNGLPLALRLLPGVLADAVYSSHKTCLFSHSVIGHQEQLWVVTNDPTNNDIISLSQVSPRSRLIDVFSLLVQRRISAVPVVDGNGQPINIFAKVDVIVRHRSQWYLSMIYDFCSASFYSVAVSYRLCKLMLLPWP